MISYCTNVMFVLTRLIVKRFAPEQLTAPAALLAGQGTDSMWQNELENDAS